MAVIQPAGDNSGDELQKPISKIKRVAVEGSSLRIENL
jgi:hypothetical protein